MGTIDVLTDTQNWERHDQLLLQLQEHYGALAPELIDALIYQALSRSGRVNLTGCDLSVVSIHTRLMGLQLVMEELGGRAAISRPLARPE